MESLEGYDQINFWNNRAINFPDGDKITSVMEFGHWRTKKKTVKDFKGFVYLITAPTGKKYIGRKNRFVKRSKKESNWRNYCGSSKDVKADIKRYGKESFRFEIIQFCKSLSELSIAEAREIINANALFDKNYYNKYLYIKLFAQK